MLKFPLSAFPPCLLSGVFYFPKVVLGFLGKQEKFSVSNALKAYSKELAERPLQVSFCQSFYDAFAL